MILNELFFKNGLIVPLDTNLTEILDKGCNSYLEQKNYGFAKFEELVKCYMNGKCSKSLIDYLCSYNEDYADKIRSLPKCVNTCLNFYCLYCSISDNNDKHVQAIYSQALMNFMVLALGNWSNLHFQNEIVELYGHLENNIREHIIAYDSNYPYDFVKKIFQDDNLLNEFIDINKLNDIKSLAALAWRVEVENYLKNLKETDPFLRVAYFLSFYFSRAPFMVPISDIVNYIEKIIPERSVTKKMSDIMQLIINNDVSYKMKISCQSSIILRRMLDDNIEEGEWINKRIGPRNFLIYLYYELLLEYKVRNDGTE